MIFMLDFMDEDEAKNLLPLVKRNFLDVFKSIWIKKEYKVNSQFGYHVFGKAYSNLSKDHVTRLINFADKERVDFMIFDGLLVKFI